MRLQITEKVAVRLERRQQAVNAAQAALNSDIALLFDQEGIERGVVKSVEKEGAGFYLIVEVPDDTVDVAVDQVGSGRAAGGGTEPEHEVAGELAEPRNGG